VAQSRRVRWEGAYGGPISNSYHQYLPLTNVNPSDDPLHFEAKVTFFDFHGNGNPEEGIVGSGRGSVLFQKVTPALGCSSRKFR